MLKMVYLLLITALFAKGDSCNIENKVPVKTPKVGGGSASVGSNGSVSAQGGQVIYVSIKNENLLGVSYTLSIRDKNRPPVANCSYSALLMPKSTVVLSNSLFAKTPIRWDVSVSIGDESDAGIVTFQVFSDKQ